MARPDAFETLFDATTGEPLALGPTLEAIYGRLSLPMHDDRPYVVVNFVETLDGVVTLESGRSGGEEVSGHHAGDRFVMALLRALADSIVTSGSSLEVGRGEPLLAQALDPERENEYRNLRARIGKSPVVRNVVVSGHGRFDTRLPIFVQDRVPVLILTSGEGIARISRADFPTNVEVRALGDGPSLNGRSIIEALSGDRLVLVEAGPRLTGELFAEHAVDELFVTLAPQIAGRADGSSRPGMVKGRLFAPRQPRWGHIQSVKRSESHLFLRYRFETNMGV